MKLAGTIIDGAVKLDQPSQFPNGTRVELAEVYPPPYNREKDITILRERIESARSGGEMLTLDELMHSLDEHLEQLHRP